MSAMLYLYFIFIKHTLINGRQVSVNDLYQ